MLALNPDTLEMVTGEELRERQIQTGEVGNGLMVFCRPDPQDPEIIQQVSRAICLTHPYPACPICPHQHFEILFKRLPDPGNWVLCPRWKSGATVNDPDFYTIVLSKDCVSKPFEFCPQCPSQDELIQINTDKTKQGWLTRYRKLSEGDSA